ncbi:capsule biosynthesis protein CapA [Leptospira perolatii]|uniref:Capsule biosynthesis protein CapA n=1 Tax=Leptospira perolatii TaxID=2023191 RepID=A0A2M9ZS36_9LEPT|nr:CapA family protein [Leptospira perolatii]PJZ71373.1 capsule biosynthesis protein CapA [Leptospira perolatii]PJZ74907.1 capsule biosynthesis protein CapA [Leptospira perolatii]
MTKVSYILYSIFVYCLCSVEIPADSAPSQPAKTLSIVAVGDIMSHQTQLDSAFDSSCSCWDFSKVFSEIAPMISEADLAVGNLETTLPGEPKFYSGYPQFGSPDSLAKTIKDIGFDVVSTANNHSCDKGRHGIIRTIQALDEIGLKHLGTYQSKKEYKKNRILRVEVGDFKLAFLNYTYGTNGLEIPSDTIVNLIDKRLISKDIRLAKSYNPDAIIVMFHYGAEYLREPDDYQKDITDFAFKSGADIVLGGHPHTVQKFGKKVVRDRFKDKKERFFVYSLGNFVSGQDRRYVDGGMVLKFKLVKKGNSTKVEDAGYEPIWVHIDKTQEKAEFRVIPIKKYLKNDQERKLPEELFQRMKEFYEDTIQVLGPPIE